MKALGLYAAAGLIIVLLVTAGAWNFLSPDARESMVMAAAIAWPLQVGLFALLARWQGEPSRFLVVWGAGILGRLGVVAAMGLALNRLGAAQPGVLLMSLVGFLFALLLLEPVFLDRGNQTARLVQ
jgi:hypothetical protein